MSIVCYCFFMMMQIYFVNLEVMSCYKYYHNVDFLTCSPSYCFTDKSSLYPQSPSSRLCLDIHSFHQYKLILAMRGSSLKSPSQNRTCPIKAYGSSTSYSPNKHFLNISLDTPVDVSSGYLCIYSKLANMFGLCIACFSIILLGHIYRTFADRHSFHKSHNIYNALLISYSTL